MSHNDHSTSPGSTMIALLEEIDLLNTVASADPNFPETREPTVEAESVTGSHRAVDYIIHHDPVVGYSSR